MTIKRPLKTNLNCFSSWLNSILLYWIKVGEWGKEEEIAHLECLKYPGDPEGDEAALQESDDFAFSCPEQLNR